MLSNLWKQLYPGVLRGSVMTGISRSQETKSNQMPILPMKCIPKLNQINERQTPIDKMIVKVFNDFNLKVILTIE